MDYQLNTLKNGLRVLSINMPHTASVSVAVYTAIGSRYETLEKQGISHFLEHMIFKGTPTRTYDDINKEVDYYGSEVNAWTGKDRTSYYIKGMAERAESFMDILSDILKNSTFPEDEVEKERQVILKEMLMDRDEVYRCVHQLNDRTMFTEQALGREIIGTEKTVNGITRDDLVSYLKDHYTGANMMLGVVGKLDHAQILEWAEKYFGDIPTGEVNKYEAAQFEPGFAVGHTEFDQSTVFMTWQGSHPHDITRFADNLAISILGDGMSSPLYTELREKRGLVYSISSFLHFEEDIGLIYIGASSTPDNFEEMIDVTKAEISKLAEHINEHDFQRAKNQIKVAMISKFEKLLGLMDYQAENVFIYGKPTTMAGLMEYIEAVTIDDCKQAFKRIMARTPSMVMTGPGGDEKFYKQLIA
jgi:predicted Zn-dependent peptidase